jgi:hypothetical protein
VVGNFCPLDDNVRGYSTLDITRIILLERAFSHTNVNAKNLYFIQNKHNTDLLVLQKTQCWSNEYTHPSFYQHHNKDTILQKNQKVSLKFNVNVFHVDPLIFANLQINIWHFCHNFSFCFFCWFLAYYISFFLAREKRM